jgi:predicted MFS family arabinose efflux permease
MGKGKCQHFTSVPIGSPSIGTYQAFMDIGLALGPVTMGIIVQLTNYRFMFLCAALVCLANLCYFRFYLRKKGNAARGA